MKIDNYFSIETDKHNWVLKYKGDPYIKKVKGIEKEVTSKYESYHPSLQALLMKYIDNSLKTESGTVTLLSKLNALESRLELLCEGITKKDIV